MEGYELVESGKGIEKLAWMPLTLRFDTRTVECICLILIEVQWKTESEVRTGS